jgi:hypothetical protein
MTTSIQTHSDNSSERIALVTSKLYTAIHEWVPGDYVIKTHKDSTVIAARRRDNSSWTNDFTIYHYETYRGEEKRKFEVSWFASSLSVKEDSYNYSEYLIILGRFVEALKNGLADAMAPYLDEISEIGSEIRRAEIAAKQAERDAQKQKIKNLIAPYAGGNIKMKETVTWFKSSRTTVKYNEIIWKQKRPGTYHLYFVEPGKSAVECTTAKFNTEDFTDFLHRVINCIQF